jgi:uncharacterized membrane protein YphA (DoxX/SURF4 family)
MEFVMLIGRILFGLIFVSSGINHFTQTEGMTGYAQFKKIPSPKLAVQGSGLVLLLGGLSVILGIWADLGAIVLALILSVMAVTMHNYWTISEPQAKQADMIGFWKNISMAGGAIFMFAILSLENTNFGFMITGPLFNTSL